MISLIVATALRCWVMPIAQQMTVAAESREHPRGLLDLGAGEPGGALARRPSRARATCAAQVVEADGVALDEVAVDGSPTRTQQRADRLEQREVAVDPDRQVQVGQLGADARRGRAAFCGLSKRIRPASGSGLTARILAPFCLAFSRAVSIRGWLVPGFWPTIDDQLGVVDVLEADGALADADASRRARPRSTRGTCSSSPAGCWCRRRGRTAGRRTRPRWRSGRRCRRPPRPGASRPRSVLGDQRERVVPGDRLVVRARPRAAPSAR